jgi:alpha-L-fucosidase 2
LQSHAGEVHLLPALPKAWPTGAVKGLRARGGLEVDITWKQGRLEGATLRSRGVVDYKVRYREQVVTVRLRPGSPAQLDGQLRRVRGRGLPG